MTQKSKEKHGKSGTDSDTDRSLFTRIMEDAVLFAIACFLVKLGIGYLLAIKIPLIITMVTVGILIIAYRSWRWRKHHDDY